MVQDLHEEVDGLEGCQLIVPDVEAHNKVQVRISSEHKFMILKLHSCRCVWPYMDTV